MISTGLYGSGCTTGFRFVLEIPPASITSSTAAAQSESELEDSESDSLGNLSFRIKLPLPSTHNYNFKVRWGEGDDTGWAEVTSWDDPDAWHTYERPDSSDGPLRVTVVLSGIIEAFSLTHNSHLSNEERENFRNSLLEIVDFGSVGLRNMQDAFNGCHKLRLANMEGDFS